MIDILQTWKDEWDLLGLDPTGASYPHKIAAYVDARLTSKLALAAPFVGSVTYTFGLAAMEAALAGMTPDANPITGNTQIANAWKAGILASALVVAGGAFIGTSTPTTLWSAPPVATIDPAPLATAYSTLVSDLIAQPVAGALGQTLFPFNLRKASAAIGFILTGLDSSTPTHLPLIYNATVQ